MGVKKWRLVGNAVCPTVSQAFAKQLRIELGLEPFNTPLVQQTTLVEGIQNLNTFSIKKFNNPPKRIDKSRFRRHPFKDGNITVTLSNYDIVKNKKVARKWITSVQYGNGEGFPNFNFPNQTHSKIEPIIKNLRNGEKLVDIINNGFYEKIAHGKELQEMFENQKSKNNLLEPTRLVEEVAEIIDNLDIEDEVFVQNEIKIFKKKNVVPVKQLFALYAINLISTKANKKGKL